MKRNKPIKSRLKAQLPCVPSKLILLALRDLERVERMKTREINMSTWHEPVGNKCLVCMAGAVMDRTLKLDPKAELTPDHSTASIHRQDALALRAVNMFRLGHCEEAFHLLGLPEALGAKFDRPSMPGYDYERRGRSFKARMRALARDLKTAGF